MKVKLQMIKNFDIDGIIRQSQESVFHLVRQSARMVSSHVKEQMWKHKDTQTGNIRDKKYTIGAVPANGEITGSTINEWPNIEKAYLVNGIYSRGSDYRKDTAAVIAVAINPDNNEHYAKLIDQRNKFLQRGFNEKRLTIYNNIQELHYFNKLK